MAAVFRPGQRVRELAPPHRAGRVFRMVRTGTYAQVFVIIDGRGIVKFYPAQLSFA